MTCMQCFQAEGIMCYDKNQDFGRIWSWTRTEDPGYGICCQKNSKALACNTSFSFNENQCSEPVHDISMQPADPQKQVEQQVSTFRPNHLMFAFCPMTNQSMCGISSNETGLDMRLSARRRKRTMKIEGLKYIEGDHLTRRYDSCYYEIQVDEVLAPEQIQKMKGKYDQLHIFINVTRKVNMNMYIYGGQNRSYVTQAIVPGNDKQPDLATTYSIEYSQGVVVIAYPANLTDIPSSQTFLEFDYWIEVYDLPGSSRWLFVSFGDSRKMNLIGWGIFSILAAISAVLLFLVCYK